MFKCKIDPTWLDFMEVGMLKSRTFFAVMLLAIVVSACSFPGASSPTPFTFPTPNLTHTAIFDATATSTPVILVPTFTETPPIEGLPTSTGTPQDTAATPPISTVPAGQRPNGTPVVAAFMSAAPIIDGELSEWDTTAYKADQAPSYARANWTGPSDVSAIYYIGWDTSNLYLAVKRTDDKFVQISSGRYMYKGDDVEIQLDADLKGDFTTTTLSADDFQIGLSPGNFGSRSEEAYRWYPRAQESWLTSVVVKAIKRGEGYDLEAKIPWVVFGITPSEGASYGFALSLSDNDLPGSATWQSMVSSVITRKLANPTSWGTLILGEPTVN